MSRSAAAPGGKLSERTPRWRAGNREHSPSTNSIVAGTYARAQQPETGRQSTACVIGRQRRADNAGYCTGGLGMETQRDLCDDRQRPFPSRPGLGQVSSRATVFTTLPPVMNDLAGREHRSIEAKGHNARLSAHFAQARGQPNYATRRRCRQPRTAAGSPGSGG